MIDERSRVVKGARPLALRLYYQRSLLALMKGVQLRKHMAFRLIFFNPFLTVQWLAHFEFLRIRAGKIIRSSHLQEQQGHSCLKHASGLHFFH